MTTALLPAQRASLRNLIRHHKGDTMITFAYPATTTADPMPNWYMQRQLDTALAQARSLETATAPTAAQDTSGPWEIEHPYGEPGTYISGPLTELVAHVYTGDNDARLIAAAPELLEALRIIDRYAAAIEANPHTGLDWEFRNMLGPVRAAIARATGESVK